MTDAMLKRGWSDERIRKFLAATSSALSVRSLRNDLTGPHCRTMLPHTTVVGFRMAPPPLVLTNALPQTTV